MLSQKKHLTLLRREMSKRLCEHSPQFLFFNKSVGQHVWIFDFLRCERLLVIVSACLEGQLFAACDNELPSSMPSTAVHTQVMSDAEEPCTKFSPFIVRPDILNNAGEGILKDIFRFVSIGNHSRNERKQRFLITAQQLFESSSIPISIGLH